MIATYSEIFKLGLGSIIGLGLFINLEKNGISIFRRETMLKALGVLTIFSTAWIVGSTAIISLLNV